MTSLTHSHRVDLAGATRSEWIKFHGLRSNLVLAGFTFALIVANALLMPWAYVFRDRSSVQADYAPYPEMIIDKTGYIGLLLAILAALLITNEYRSGQIKMTLLSVPKRIPALAAKALVIAGVSFLIGVASAGIGLAIAPAILAGGGYSYELGLSDALRLILGSGLYLATLSIIGIALGAIIRNVVASVLSTIALLVILPIIPQIFSEYGGEAKRFFPIEAGSLLLGQSTTDSLGPWIGYLILAIWALGLLALAAVLFKRRDA